MKKSWLKETARDFLAFGSVPFYFLVVIRAVIGKYDVFVYQMVIAAIVVFILYFIIKNSDLHVARSLAAVVFTSIFYNALLYTFFAALVWVLLVIAAYYVKRNMGFVLRGVIIGLISSVAGYYGALYLL
mgnify:CR=1 FL=1